MLWLAYRIVDLCTRSCIRVDGLENRRRKCISGLAQSLRYVVVILPVCTDSVMLAGGFSTMIII